MLFIQVRHDPGAGRHLCMPGGHWCAVCCGLHLAMLLLALLLLPDRHSLVGELLCALPCISCVQRHQKSKSGAPFVPAQASERQNLKLLSITWLTLH